MSISQYLRLVLLWTLLPQIQNIWALAGLDSSSDEAETPAAAVPTVQTNTREARAGDGTNSSHFSAALGRQVIDAYQDALYLDEETPTVSNTSTIGDNQRIESPASHLQSDRFPPTDLTNSSIADTPARSNSSIAVRDSDDESRSQFNDDVSNLKSHTSNEDRQRRERFYGERSSIFDLGLMFFTLSQHTIRGKRKRHATSEDAFNEGGASGDDESIGKSFTNSPRRAFVPPQGHPVKDRKLNEGPERSNHKPETRAISQEKLIAEIKGIYFDLVIVKDNYIDLDAAHSSDNTTRLNDEQWQALITLHRTLLHKHRDFFLANQHLFYTLDLPTDNGNKDTELIESTERIDQSALLELSEIIDIDEREETTSPCQETLRQRISSSPSRFPGHNHSVDISQHLQHVHPSTETSNSNECTLIATTSCDGQDLNSSPGLAADSLLPCPHCSCSRNFLRQCDLNKHMMSYTKSILCDIDGCGYRCATRRDLVERHQPAKHPEVFGKPVLLYCL